MELFEELDLDVRGNLYHGGDVDLRSDTGLRQEDVLKTEFPVECHSVSVRLI